MGRTNHSKNERGFTLIELLVVLAVIGLLSSVILGSLTTARTKSRDARRISDLRQVEKALQIYLDKNGSYPSTSGAWRGTCTSYGSYPRTGAGAYIPNLAPTYIPILPVDPAPIGADGCYVYNSNGTDFMFMAHTTVETFDPDEFPNVGNPPHPLDRQNFNQQSISVFSPGARLW